MSFEAKKSESLQPEVLAALAKDVREGLSSRPKSLPSRWLYEGAGSDLFEMITELDEYYPTRAERAILAEHVTEIVLLAGASSVIELGSGTSEKTGTHREIPENCRTWSGG
jgi:L-histidine N-alpha-methyltransferase